MDQPLTLEQMTMFIDEPLLRLAIIENENVTFKLLTQIAEDENESSFTRMKAEEKLKLFF